MSENSRITPFPPRAPTDAEQWAVYKLFPTLSPFQMMGRRTRKYNCLEWAISQSGQPYDQSMDYKNPALYSLPDTTAILEAAGFERTTEELATIDVWGGPVPRGGHYRWKDAKGNVVRTLRQGRYFVEHFSRKTPDGWTSKLGDAALIVHERYGMVSKNPDEPGFYHAVIAHFKEKDSEPQASAEVRPDTATEGQDVDTSVSSHSSQDSSGFRDGSFVENSKSNSSGESDPSIENTNNQDEDDSQEYY